MNCSWTNPCGVRPVPISRTVRHVSPANRPSRAPQPVAPASAWRHAVGVARERYAATGRRGSRSTYAQTARGDISPLSPTSTACVLPPLDRHYTPTQPKTIRQMFVHNIVREYIILYIILIYIYIRVCVYTQPELAPSADTVTHSCGVQFFVHLSRDENSARKKLNEIESLQRRRDGRGGRRKCVL